MTVLMSSDERTCFIYLIDDEKAITENDPDNIITKMMLKILLNYFDFSLTWSLAESCCWKNEAIFLL